MPCALQSQASVNAALLQRYAPSAAPPTTVTRSVRAWLQSAAATVSAPVVAVSITMLVLASVLVFGVRPALDHTQRPGRLSMMCDDAARCSIIAPEGAIPCNSSMWDGGATHFVHENDDGAIAGTWQPDVPGLHLSGRDDSSETRRPRTVP